MVFNYWDESGGIPALDIRPRPPSPDSQREHVSERVSVSENLEHNAQSTAEGLIAPSSSSRVITDLIMVEVNPSAPVNQAGSNLNQEQRGIKERNISARKQGGKRRRLRFECLLCHKEFTRNEHLLRHERARKSLPSAHPLLHDRKFMSSLDRNERPFACSHCDSRFTRQDLIKRHTLRYHPETARESSECPRSEQLGPAQVEVDLSTSAHLHSIPGTRSDKSRTTAAQQSPPALDSPFPILGSAAESHDASTSASPSQLRNAMPDPSDTVIPFDMNTLMANIDFDDTRNFQAGPALDGDFLQELVMTPAVANLISLSLPSTQTNMIVKRASQENGKSWWRSSWHGSLELSEAKYSYIVKETKKMDSLVGTRLLHYTCFRSLILRQARVGQMEKLPSRLAFERYLTSFFHYFLCYLPFIHVPTWKAETSQPALLLAMAAHGANVHHEPTVALRLHRFARLTVLNIVC